MCRFSSRGSARLASRVTSSRPGFGLRRRVPALLLLLTGAPLAAASPGDWTNWRGAGNDGVSHETGLPATWSQEGENLVWKNLTVTGRSAPIVMNGRVYLLCREGSGIHERERLVCLNADTGELAWQVPLEVFHTTIPNTRVGWTSPVGDPETGCVYGHSTGGLVFCADASGKIVWSHSLTEEYNRISGYGGRLQSPTLDGDLVIVGMLNASWGDQAGGGHRLVAFDKRTGNVVWWSKPGGKPQDTIYSTPVVAEINGQRLLIGGGADGYVYAVQAQTGKPVWQFQLCKLAVNVSPVVYKNRVYVSHGEDNVDNTVMGRLTCIDATGTGDVSKTHEVWRVDGLGAGYASPATLDGRIYVIDNSAFLFCLDADSGKEIWRHKLGKVGKGSPVLADGKIYATEVNSHFLILENSPSGAKLLDEETFTDDKGGVVDVYGSPAIANGRVYFATDSGVYCLGSKQPRPSPVVGAIPPPQKAPDGAATAMLLAYPADVLLKPGTSATFVARAYDAQGRLIGDVKPAWSGKLPRTTLSADGTLAVGADHPGGVGVIEAKVGELTATARVRIAAHPPFAQDFDAIEAGKFPPHWIGAGGKFAVAEKDGQRVLVKKTENPSLARGDIYMSVPELSGYTVRADVCAAKKSRNLPDMGLIANRYRFELMGNTQKMRLVSWVPAPRIQQVLPFSFKEDEWFSMKLRVDVKGDVALVRGKVWKRGESEPADWSITLEDPIGHRQGAPGLYGFSLAEIFYDNVAVTPNE
ncbi:MAG: Outer membrane protein assembly factor BamB [Phycisphaerae bacterium]|nr:Outer membrane protein assembly factor BamB [Phycisphaerae bacterium]